MKAVVEATHTDLNDQYFGPRPAPAPTTIQGTQQPALGPRSPAPATPTPVPSSTPAKSAPQTSSPPK
jgi:hypothetical protein